ncbi:hypothetical protein ACM3BL_09855 [Mammaliicoccus sciuri]
MLEVGEQRNSNFSLSGFWFEKEVIYYDDYIDMKIKCNRTERTVVSACFFQLMITKRRKKTL